MRKVYNLIFLLLITLSANELKAQVNTRDSLALLAFYNSTNGPHWARGWSTTTPVSRWYGVTVTANRVTALTLWFNNLTGNIPDSIGYLTALTDMYLPQNQVTGPLPTSMGNLINLENLDIDLNKLSGDIPGSFSKLTKLHYLNLNDNRLTGGISFLGKLHNLHDIELADNQLSGKIPAINCINLHDILLGHNQFSGSIPTFGKDTATDTDVAIDLNHNNLSGSISHQFDSVMHLAYLFLNNNQLTGKIPASLNKLVSVTALDVSYNQLSGKIPSLVNLTHLFLLNLQNNQFTFSGMEKVAAAFSFAVYTPQANININQNGNRLSVAAGGTISNNTYNWYKNGVLYKTKTGNAGLTVNGNGNFSVAVTNSIATQLVLYSDTVRVTNLLQQNSFASMKPTGNALSIYPNPVKTIATISIHTIGSCTIRLADVPGNILQTKTVISNGAYTFQLDVSKYAAGIYFVSVISDKGQMQTLQLNKE